MTRRWRGLDVFCASCPALDALGKASQAMRWKRIVRGRRAVPKPSHNRIAHGYFDINLDLVWDTVQNALPPLVDALRELE